MFRKFVLGLFVGCLSVMSSVEAYASDQAYHELDQLAVQAGTDKSSVFHNYTKVYARYFQALREQPMKFLEIGIFQGNSVKLWESYFTKADLHFIDIDNSRIQYFSERSHYYFLDQANSVALNSFAAGLGGDFDIIIDDGGHLMDQQIISFKTLFPYLKSGGYYVIEDLHTSYWKGFGGGGTLSMPKSGPNTCTEFLKGLVDDVNYTAAVTACADSDKISQEIRRRLSTYQKDIESIHFYQSLCIIIKK
ncbi:MAG: hypothetical protein H0X51_09130 [Parachlamydiaceae bacterium]|nr:hypothetical protein [Parachlamydiaceae bacterium]